MFRLQFCRFDSRVGAGRLALFFLAVVAVKTIVRILRPHGRGGV